MNQWEPQIDEVFAVIARDLKGQEGVISVDGPTGTTTLAFSRRELLEKARPLIQRCATDLPEMKVMIVRFSNRQVLEVVGG